MLDEVQEEANPFEVDLNCLVILNHEFTIQKIDLAEQKDMDDLEKSLAGEDSDMIGSFLFQITSFYQGLRRAARNMAVVGLVTRFDHWIEKYMQERQIPRHSKEKRTLIAHLCDLNKYLHVDFESIDFFKGLVNARDSVIHQDSRTEWEWNGESHTVPQQCSNPYNGELDVSEDYLKEAKEKITKQVRWYDERIAELVASNQDARD